MKFDYLTRLKFCWKRNSNTRLTYAIILFYSKSVIKI